MGDYQRKPIRKPTTPPPPPPKPKRTFAETGEFLLHNPVYHMPNIPQGAQTKGGQTSPDQKKDDLPSSPPSRIYPSIEPPPLPPRNTVSLSSTPPDKSLSNKSPVAESTPKKGIFRNVYTRAREFFTGKSASTTYQISPQQAPPATSTTTPKKRGIFRGLWGGSTTPILHQNDTMSPDRNYSGDSSRLNDSSLSSDRGPLSADISPDASVSAFAEASGGRYGTMGSREADTSSDVSSDWDGDECYARVQRRESSRSMSIRVNSAANISLTASDSGEMTACIQTASDRQKE